MAIPDYQTVMLPLLEFLASDQKQHHLQEVTSVLEHHFELSEKERTELLPSGQYPTFKSRVGWASTYMKEAGLLERPQRGYMKITDRGLSVASKKPAKIDAKFLEQYSEFIAFRQRSKKSGEQTAKPGSFTETKTEDEQTPVETIEAAYRAIRGSLASEILQQIKECSPEFFERLVVDLLVKMGYGGTREDAGRAIGKSGDEGIDGIINEDRLGLDMIYIQAKRWKGIVGRPEIQQFAGALQGQKARKGVFITTSNFSKTAAEYARNIESSIVLIDGEMLAGLMVDHDVGVTLETSYEIKRIDSDYFDEA